MQEGPLAAVTEGSRVRLLGSLTSLDPLTLGRDAARLLEAGVDGVHIDIADGHFVPFLTFAPRIVRSLRAMGAALIDVHLMVADPEAYIAELGEYGADRIAFHIEAVGHPWRTVSLLRRAGVQAGVAIDAATPPTTLRMLARSVDFINVQTSGHDLDGDAAIPGIEDRIREFGVYLPDGTALQVDGGVTERNASDFIASGATEIVVGKAICGSADWGAAVQRLRRATADGIGLRR